MNRLDDRPRLREVLFSAERKPEIYFYTSNEHKFLQARLVFARAGLQLRHFQTHTDPYFEDYELGTHGLLAKAVQQISTLTSGASIFFVEDTSLRIDALSGPDDFPGMRVKEWFSETSFEELDSKLVSMGGNRKAIVKSDIALHLPGLPGSVFFHGETAGLVALSRPQEFQSAQHPWLTSHNFNGWFVPGGATRRLGEMSLDESWRYDFRVKALLSLIDRLEEYTAAMNLPVNAYVRRRKTASGPQLHLLPRARRVIVVVGKTCAGKSVFGSRASDQDIVWVEASDIVRSFKERHGSESESVATFAREFLADRGQDVVCRRILDLIEGEPDAPVCITGFRTLEEIECMRARIPECEIVLVEASERTRFERYVARARPGASLRLADFIATDAEQSDMGLLAVAEDFADTRIVNEGSMEEYLYQVDAVIASDREGVPGVSNKVGSVRVTNRSQLRRCLTALADDGRALDCNEISALTANTGAVIRFNNVNKMLKRYPFLAQRLEMMDANVRYRITETGRTYLRMVGSPSFKARARKAKAG